jgi:hypothetical protein
MAEPRQKRADRAIWPALLSPGSPPPRREVERDRALCGNSGSSDLSVSDGVTRHRVAVRS